ncbi:hypothetical protein SK128_017942 [Halocaridina rubra]|uniref:Uncharacterized protein n=1 Tax=Halocaridina rubra TaxID=373956 RepID=A0AAN8XBX1_HALRR
MSDSEETSDIRSVKAAADRAFGESIESDELRPQSLGVSGAVVKTAVKDISDENQIDDDTRANIPKDTSPEDTTVLSGPNISNADKGHEKSPESTSASSRGSSPGDTDSEKKMSLGEKTRERVTTEPKFSVAIGRAKILPSPDHEDDPDTFRGPAGETLTLENAVRLKKIDGDTGAVIDVARGEPLTINEAIERGVLDSVTGDVFIPVGRSITLPEVVSQGLLDRESQKCVHPETGGILTLSEALLCDIIDPVSQIVEPSTRHTITLEEAIERGIVDANTGEIQQKQGPVSVLEAVESDIFVTPAVPRIDWLPPLGMTFPVVLERGLIDGDKKEVIHPLTNDRLPLISAIEDDFILALPCPILPESVQVTQALDCKLIDIHTCTFIVPKTGEKLPVERAVESGLLHIKPMTIATPSSDAELCQEIIVTDTVKSFETITTKKAEMKAGFVLISPSEVKNVGTGEVLSVEDAKKQGIIRFSEFDGASQEKINFREAVEDGHVDFGSGTFKDPVSGEVLPIDKD